MSLHYDSISSILLIPCSFLYSLRTQKPVPLKRLHHIGILCKIELTRNKQITAKDNAVFELNVNFVVNVPAQSKLVSKAGAYSGEGHRGFFPKNC